MHTGPLAGHLTTRRMLLLMALTATIVAVVATLSTMAAVAASDRFGDVGSNHPHADGIGFMADSGVTLGCAEGQYCPSDSVTRAQMGTFMHRLSGNDPATDPSVNAATLQGKTAAELQNDGRLDALEARLDDLEAENAALTALLADVSREQVDGNDTLVLSGMNLQVVNGEGETDQPNGVGNVIVGYNGDTRVGAEPDRTGSHYVVVGDGHGWTGFGGMLAGQDNTSSGPWASVVGGVSNTASGEHATVSGGRSNTASGDEASVLGGGSNVASADTSSAVGGQSNDVGGFVFNSIVGGRNNEITGGARWATILGNQNQSLSADLSMYPTD